VGRRAARVDDNQGDIVGWFRGLGCSVHITSAVGDGFTDLVVGVWGMNALVEVKDPAKVPSARKLTPAQVEFHRDWRGKIFVVETMDDVLAVVDWMHQCCIAIGGVR